MDFENAFLRDDFLQECLFSANRLSGFGTVSQTLLLFFAKSLAIRRKMWYNGHNKIYLIKSSVVTGTMMLQQPAFCKVLIPVR